MLEEVRFLLNFRMDSQSPLALILVGQNELRERLQLQAYTAIRQRVDLQCKLHHYDRAQTDAYMTKHLQYAGSSQAIFSDKAVDALYRYSGGTPRLINKVSTHSLLYGAPRIISACSMITSRIFSVLEDVRKFITTAH